MLQVCTKTFATLGALGTQRITVTDKDGDTFLPRLIFYAGGYVQLNALTSEAYGVNLNPAFMLYDVGMVSDELSLAASSGSGDIWPFHTFKSGSGSGSNAPIVDTQPGIFFGGQVSGYAYVSAIGVGYFDLTWLQQDGSSTYRAITVLGGSNLVFDINAISSFTLSTTGPACAVLFAPLGPGASSTTPIVSTGAGVRSFGWGWDTRDSGRGAMCSIPMSVSASYQDTNVCGLQLDGAGNLSADDMIISVWGPNSFTFTGQVPGGYGAYSFGGTGIAARAGSFIQQAGTGNQSFSVDIDARWLFLISSGAEDGAGVIDTNAQLVTGWSDGLRQTGYWTNETEGASSGVTPLTGARYLSDSEILRFAELSDTTSTIFTAIASLVSIDSDGTVTINWTTNDAVPRKILWFALGVEASPLPPALAGAGIYKLVPEKLNDTIWIDARAETTVDHKIPDPSATTGLIGDE